MFIQLRTITVTEGNSEQVVDRFKKPGILEEQEGFADLKILVKKVRRGEEEVMILVTWESEEAWKQWEKSDAHIAGHRAKNKQQKPEFIIKTEVGKYEVKAIKKPV